MAIVLPENILGFLDRATVAIVGTRDRDLVPHVHRVSGWSVGDDGATITCLVPQHFTAHLLSSLEDNGQFALTVSEVPSHETYQFKGDFVGSREVDPTDLVICKSHRERFTARIGELFGFPEQALETYMPDPSVALDFSVREVFIQTPGPDAGKRLLPPEDGDHES